MEDKSFPVVQVRLTNTLKWLGSHSVHPLRLWTEKGLLSWAELALVLLLVGTVTFLIVRKPPAPFYVLPLAPIALAAVLYEFVGGTLAALVAISSITLLIAFDPNNLRRALILQEVWPILTIYLAVGPLVGWIAARSRERDREIARLYERQRARSRALTAISVAGREIAASQNLERTLRQVMQKAAATLPMEAGALFILDEEEKMYRVVASHNLPQQPLAQITFAFDEGVPGWVSAHHETLNIPEATADTRVHPRVIEAGVHTVLSIPLIAREKTFGVLNLYGIDKQASFDREAERLAQVFADQAAVFIENARLIDALRAAAAQLEERVERRTEQLKQSQAQVLRAEKFAIVGRLATSVAHEVNNPLQAIALHLDPLSREVQSPQGKQKLTIVQQELARIAKISQRLLDFQQPATGEKHRQQLDLLLDDVLALANKQIQQGNVDVVRKAVPNLPPACVVADQIKQVFLNLILNAVEAMPTGGQLTITSEQRQQQLRISFTDDGKGISAATMQHLFEPFFSTKHNGTGLGLAISHEIICQHNGELHVQSEPGAGATFIIDLPAAAEASCK